jgi:hypothetical protein
MARRFDQKTHLRYTKYSESLFCLLQKGKSGTRWAAACMIVSDPEVQRLMTTHWVTVDSGHSGFPWACEPDGGFVRR